MKYIPSPASFNLFQIWSEWYDKVQQHIHKYIEKRSKASLSEPERAPTLWTEINWAKPVILRYAHASVLLVKIRSECIVKQSLISVMFATLKGWVTYTKLSIQVNKFVVLSKKQNKTKQKKKNIQEKKQNKNKKTKTKTN